MVLAVGTIVAVWAAAIANVGVSASEAIEVTQYVFASIIPLFGAWVGTVLAFYFGREQFEAATRSVQETIRSLSPEERLRQIAVADSMIPRGEMAVLRLESDADEDRIKVADLRSKFGLQKVGGKEIDVSRLPILKKDDSVLCVVHRSLVDSFVANPNAPADQPDSKTLKEFLAAKDVAEKSACFDVLPRTATLSDAKAAMLAKTGCQDVFITATGKAAEAVLGWVTNMRILERERS